MVKRKFARLKLDVGFKKLGEGTLKDIASGKPFLSNQKDGGVLVKPTKSQVQKAVKELRERPKRRGRKRNPLRDFAHSIR